MPTYQPSDYDPDLAVDPNDGYKASKIKLNSFARPHMRSFHFAWLSFFVAFLGWFALAPLGPVLKKDLGLTKQQLWQANITSVASTVAARFIVGPMCDKFGPKTIQTILLLLGAFFTLCAPLAKDASGLIAVRFFIGIVGSTFVCTQYWSAMLFTKETAGAAQAVSGGWGNLGGGVAQLFMASIYTAIKNNGNEPGVAWRLAMIVPAVMLICVASVMYFASDDCPQGDYKELVKAGRKKNVNAAEVAKDGFSDPATWILSAQYAGCFGVELTVNNAMTTYFVDQFDLPLVTASAIAMSFGAMNLFARALGGLLSDFFNKKMAMRGRLIVQGGCLIAEGIMLIIFSRQTVLGSAIPCLLLFSLCVQASEGATFAIVPYVNKPATGAVAGVVGAGGNIGAVSWGMIFLFSGMSAPDCFQTVGIIVLGLGLLTPFIFLKGPYDGLFINPRKTADYDKAATDDVATGA